jgi:hypothetical protein
VGEIEPSTIATESGHDNTLTTLVSSWQLAGVALLIHRSSLCILDISPLSDI